MILNIILARVPEGGTLLRDFRELGSHTSKPEIQKTNEYSPKG